MRVRQRTDVTGVSFVSDRHWEHFCFDLDGGVLFGCGRSDGFCAGSDGFCAGSDGFRAHHNGNVHGRNLQRIPTGSLVCGHPEPSVSNGTDVGSLALEPAEPYIPTGRAVHFDEVEFVGPHHYPQQRIPTGSLALGGSSRAVRYEGVESAVCFDEVECVSPHQFSQQRILVRLLAPGGLETNHSNGRAVRYNEVGLAGGNNIPQQRISSGSFSLEHLVHYHSNKGPVSFDEVEFGNPDPYPQQQCICASPLALRGQVSSPSNERSVCFGEKGLVNSHPKAQQLISEDSVSPQGFLALYNGVCRTFFPHDDPINLVPPKSIKISSASSSTHSSIISNDETTTKGYILKMNSQQKIIGCFINQNIIEYGTSPLSTERWLITNPRLHCVM
eukprot:scaffold165075_cov52-Attheya_sp.AAC.3